MSRGYLIDTHCWLWWNAAPERLSPEAREIVADPSNEIMLSAASAWEIAIKHALGKLRLPEAPATYVESRLLLNRMTGLPIHLRHALHAGELPPHHRDPFDRMIIAQARVEALTVITADEVFRRYEVDLIWSG